MSNSIEVKIGRKLFNINSSDRFMDNGACIQLLGHNGKYLGYGSYSSPLVSKKLMKELLSKYEKTDIVNFNESGSCKIFSLNIK